MLIPPYKVIAPKRMIVHPDGRIELTLPGMVDVPIKPGLPDIPDTPVGQYRVFVCRLAASARIWFYVTGTFGVVIQNLIDPTGATLLEPGESGYFETIPTQSVLLYHMGGITAEATIQYRLFDF